MNGRKTIISLTTRILQKNLKTGLIFEDPAEKLILQCLPKHARSNATEIKAFLSGNSKEFEVGQVKETLRDAGITKYFSHTKDFLGWLNSRQNL